MFILYAVVLGILIGYILGGSLKGLIQQELRWRGLVIFAFLIQLVIFTDIPFLKITSGATVFFHAVSYLSLMVFIALNLRIKGMPLIGSGIFSNALVIFLNGGYMPTIPKNLLNTAAGRTAQAIAQGDAVHNSAGMTSHTLLPWLGDIFYLPSWVPMSNVFSIGDILVAIGICLYLIISMRSVGNNKSTGT